MEVYDVCNCFSQEALPSEQALAEWCMYQTSKLFGESLLYQVPSLGSGPQIQPSAAGLGKESTKQLRADCAAQGLQQVHDIQAEGAGHLAQGCA